MIAITNDHRLINVCLTSVDIAQYKINAPVCHGSIENTHHSHCAVSLQHDRTGGTEKLPFWHRGRQMGWSSSSSSEGQGLRWDGQNMTGQTNILKAKL